MAGTTGASHCAWSTMETFFYRAWSTGVFFPFSPCLKHVRLSHQACSTWDFVTVHESLAQRERLTALEVQWNLFFTALEARECVFLSRRAWSTGDCLTMLVAPGTLSQCMKAWQNGSVSLRLKYNGNFFLPRLKHGSVFSFSPCLKHGRLSHHACSTWDFVTVHESLAQSFFFTVLEASRNERDH